MCKHRKTHICTAAVCLSAINVSLIMHLCTSLCCQNIIKFVLQCLWVFFSYISFYLLIIVTLFLWMNMVIFLLKAVLHELQSFVKHLLKIGIITSQEKQLIFHVTIIGRNETYASCTGSSTPLLSDLNNYNLLVSDWWYLQSRDLFLPTKVSTRLTFAHTKKKKKSGVSAINVK